MRWSQGRADIDDMLVAARPPMQRVPPSREHADRPSCPAGPTDGWQAAALRPVRRRRRDAEYPSSDAPMLTADDVVDDLPKAEEILVIATQLLDQMSP